MGNLVIGRRRHETIILTTGCGERIEVMVGAIRDNQVRLSIAAPQSVQIWRGEIADAAAAGRCRGSRPGTEELYTEMGGEA